MSIPVGDELIIGGDGDSAETAIEFRPCRLGARIAREHQFISERFGVENVDWEEEMHMTSLALQSVWSIRLSDGSERRVYFDTSQTIYDES